MSVIWPAVEDGRCSCFRVCHVDVVVSTEGRVELADGWEGVAVGVCAVLGVSVLVFEFLDAVF